MANRETVVQHEPFPEPPTDDARLHSRGDPTLGELLETVFDLRRRHVEVYCALLDHQGCTVEQLSSVVDLDRSNVQRHLNALRERGLVHRWRRVLDSGGHFYQYAARPPNETRELMQEAFDDWAERARDRLDDLPALAHDGVRQRQ